MATYRTEFELKGPPREILDQNVGFLDQSLAQAAGCPVDQVLHAIDPRRILKFEYGGPPVWSVAVAPVGNDAYLWVTYGLSSIIDPAMPFGHEMSIEVAVEPGAPVPQWPMFFLRSLARYQITSRRELKVGDVMPFPVSITRAAMAPEHHQSMPDSSLRAIAVVADPRMQAVRRVVGLLEEEVEISKLWNVEGFVGAIGSTRTVLDRRSHLDDAAFVRACRAGSEKEGSSTSAALVEGVRWARDTEGLLATIPRGPNHARTMAHIEARLKFGRSVLLHGSAMGEGTEVALVPNDDDIVRARILNPALVELAGPLQFLRALLSGDSDPITMRVSTIV